MDNSKSALQEREGLVRQLGLFDCTMMLMGLTIGSGIYLTTGIMAESIPSAGLIILAWIFGGLFAIGGAIIFAELGAAMPEAGGQYIYLKEAFGPLSGFLFGWIYFVVYISGAVAALGAAFGEYFGYFFPALGTGHELFSIPFTVAGESFLYTLTMGQITGIAVIVIISAANFYGVVYGKIIQNVTTVIKIATILIFIALGLTIGRGITIDYSLNPAGLSFGQMMVGFAVALVAVSWAYDSWNNISFIAGEIKNPQRIIPLSLFLGIAGIMLLYILVNFIYIYALPIDEMAGVVRIAEKSSNALFGATTAGLISAAVAISVLGALNGKVFVGPRIYYAMAKDRLFFAKVAEVHPRFHTPGFAIIVQAVWACILIMTGTFGQLLVFVMFVAILFWIAAALSVFALRKKYPALPRPYKIWGYPATPVLFIIVSAGILLNTVIEKPVESAAGIGLTLIGIPIYYYWKKKSGNN
ncbi:APC family permease [candidate division KSB1 bacterium]